MFQFLVNSEGGLTAAGYALSVASAVIFFILAVWISRTGQSQARKKAPASQLVYCGAAVALGYIASYIKLFSMPFGGTVTLFSMLFICLVGYWYGIRVGICTGLAYGILQFLQEPFVLNLIQVCCDYILAFAALGLSGVFRKSKNGLLKGFLLGAFARGIFHVIGGYLFWMDYMPDNFPKTLSLFYPIIYNYSYIGVEAFFTAIVITLPPVAKAMARVKQNA